MRTSSALAPIRSAAASAIAPTVIEWLCVPGARRTSSWSSGWVMSPSSSRLMPVTMPNDVLEEREAAAEEEAGHQAPAAAPEARRCRIRPIGWSCQRPVAQVSTK